MHNSKPARTNKETKTGQIIRIEQEQLNKHLDNHAVTRSGRCMLAAGK